jgi:predicted RecB family endonuclease
MTLTIANDELLAYALVGLQARRGEIDQAIDELHSRLQALDGTATEPSEVAVPKRTKRHMSAEARARISRASKRRWKRYRAAKRTGSRG